MKFETDVTKDTVEVECKGGSDNDLSEWPKCKQSEGDIFVTDL